MAKTSIQTRTCPVCGKKFKSDGFAICSPECLAAQVEKTREKQKEKASDIARLAMSAEKEGMTYGQYVAQFSVPRVVRKDRY